jgi:hypothetical protein
MAGNLGALGRSTAQWSAINNCTDWVTSQQTEADNQILPDGGSIQALFGYNYSATILQEFGIKVATYEGPPLIFRFAKISEGLGCSIPAPRRPTTTGYFSIPTPAFTCCRRIRF